MDNSILWTLIAVQVAMGAFDTLYHHEGTERLAWRASQKNELRLHGEANGPCMAGHGAWGGHSPIRHASVGWHPKRG